MSDELTFDEPIRLAFIPESDRQRDIVHHLVDDYTDFGHSNYQEHGRRLYVSPLGVPNEHRHLTEWYVDEAKQADDLKYVEVDGDLERFLDLFFNAKVDATTTHRWDSAAGEIRWREGSDQVEVVVKCGERREVPVDEVLRLEDYTQDIPLHQGSAILPANTEVLFKMEWADVAVEIGVLREIVHTLKANSDATT